jgi:DtxR family Mn-dependent transcriptional regulator
MPAQKLLRLTELPEGSAGRIARIEQQEQAVLRYLESLGLLLNARVELVGIAPFGGVVTVRVASPAGKATPQAIGGELAHRILVDPLDQAVTEERR